MKESNIRSERIVSIDALRGFDMFWITGGAGVFLALFRMIDSPITRGLAAQLHHSKWNGFTFWDLIFPLFLFIVGVALPLSLSKRLKRGDSKREIIFHMIKRTAVLIMLGFIYNGILDLNFSEFRYAGVLQRIAICYFFSSFIVLYFNIRGQAITFALLLVIYWSVMKLVPVPGFGPGVLTPEGNLSGYIDRLLLPGKFCCYGFGDNEGILSTVPAVATTLMGVLSGHLLKSNYSQINKAIRLLIAGTASILLGAAWSLIFPINKLIWTSSYVLYTGGWSMILLSVFYWIIDIKRWKKWAFPFIVIGMNPITIYVAQSVFDFGIIAGIFVHGFINHLGAFRPLFWAICVLCVKWLFLYFLYRQKIFLKA